MTAVFRFSAIACCLLTASAANAMPRLGREGTGLVQSVDRNNRRFAIKLEGDARLRTFDWNKDTRFFQGYASTNPRALRSGIIVSIYYHVPFFGRPFVTKVVFLVNPTARRRGITDELGTVRGQPV